MSLILLTELEQLESSWQIMRRCTRRLPLWILSSGHGFIMTPMNKARMASSILHNKRDKENGGGC